MRLQFGVGVLVEHLSSMYTTRPWLQFPVAHKPGVHIYTRSQALHPWLHREFELGAILWVFWVQFFLEIPSAVEAYRTLGWFAALFTVPRVPVGRGDSWKGPEVWNLEASCSQTPFTYLLPVLSDRGSKLGACTLVPAKSPSFPRDDMLLASWSLLFVKLICALGI